MIFIASRGEEVPTQSHFGKGGETLALKVSPYSGFVSLDSSKSEILQDLEDPNGVWA